MLKEQVQVEGEHRQWLQQEQQLCGQGGAATPGQTEESSGQVQEGQQAWKKSRLTSVPALSPVPEGSLHQPTHQQTSPWPHSMLGTENMVGNRADTSLPM